MIVQDDLILHVLIQNQILEDLRDPQILHGLQGLQDLAKETNALKEVIVRVLTDQDLIAQEILLEKVAILSLEMSVLAIAH